MPLICSFFGVSMATLPESAGCRALRVNPALLGVAARLKKRVRLV
ncbi:hypothetical protein [Carnimonas bestiolae]